MLLPDLPFQSMTLLGAFPGDGQLVVVADSASHNVGVEGGEQMASRESVLKIHHVRQEPLVYGYAGDGAVGQPFADWLETEADLSSWGILAKTAGARLFSENQVGIQRVRQMAASLGQQVDPHDFPLTQVLIAGYVGGKPDALKINVRGLPTLLDGRSEAFVGQGVIQAETALRMIRDINPETDWSSPESVYRFFGAAVDHIGTLEGPVNLWTLDLANGVQRWYSDR